MSLEHRQAARSAAEVDAHEAAPDSDGDARSTSRASDPARLLTPIALAALVAAAVRPLSDPDSFWHIAAGDLLRRSFDLNRPDPFSSATSRPWILEQWLPETLFSYLRQWGGLGAVAWIVPATYAVFLCLMWWFCRSRSSPRMALVLTLVAAIAAAPSFSPRPQVFSIIFIVVTVDAWLRTSLDGRSRWWLIPVTWIWACCHGFWFYGPLLGAMFLAGLVLDRAVSRQQIRKLVMVPVASFGAALLTPLGPGILLAPLHVRGVTRFITEWAPPPANALYFVAVLVLATLALTGMARTVFTWQHLLPAVAALGPALMYARSAAVAGAILAPLVAAIWTGGRRPIRSGPTAGERRAVVGATTVVACLGAVVSMSFFAAPQVSATALDRQLAALPAGTVMCNDNLLGGWLILEHPNVRVTMDGRAELYSVGHIQSYLRFLAAQPGWDSYVNDTHCRYALVGDQTAVSEALVSQTHWATVANAGGYVLLKAPAGN